MMPALFIAHGAPLLAIEENDYTEYLNDLGQSLERPRAVVLFSAHWESQIQEVSHVADAYDTIYDFGGFPRALYEIKYPAPGAPDIAAEVERLIAQAGVQVHADAHRGLDHGAWVVLRLLYPEADVPVVSMSVNPSMTPSEQYEIGKALSSLRQQGVLIIGSGGTVHNLRALKMFDDSGRVDSFAADFDNWLTEHLLAWDTQALFQYNELAPGARMAVPMYGNEHFVPLFYAMGAADDSKQAKLLHQTYRYGNLSQTVWQFE